MQMECDKKVVCAEEIARKATEQTKIIQSRFFHSTKNRSQTFHKREQLQRTKMLTMKDQLEEQKKELKILRVNEKV